MPILLSQWFLLVWVQHRCEVQRVRQQIVLSAMVHGCDFHLWIESLAPPVCCCQGHEQSSRRFEEAMLGMENVLALWCWKSALSMLSIQVQRFHGSSLEVHDIFCVVSDEVVSNDPFSLSSAGVCFVVSFVPEVNLFLCLFAAAVLRFVFSGSGVGRAPCCLCTTCSCTSS
mmetsp:Transcript_13360/g.18677  ORF Transcript_13360/g.18677 Transcript_13360/m.18677 type:complete len:171 (-) Transcript_13360:67-579(-)